MTTTHTLAVRPIDPRRLDAVRRAGEDGFGNPLVAHEATGAGEPLRCCLRFARAGEPIALISFAPLAGPSPWREVGPVYVHAEPCEGYVDGSVPSELRRGPAVLRAYRADGSMSYDHHTLVAEGQDLEPELERLLAEPEVTTVHVRTVLPQCFLYAVTRRG